MFPALFKSDISDSNLLMAAGEALSHLHYLEYRGDYAGLVLLDLYRSYFAMVRAKVALLREPEDAPELAATPLANGTGYV